MAKKTSSFRLVYRQSSPLLKGVVLAAIVLSTVALLSLRGSIERSKAQEQALRQQAAVIEAENRDYAERISKFGSKQSYQQIAQEELDLIDPGSVIFNPVE